MPSPVRLLAACLVFTPLAALELHDDFAASDVDDSRWMTRVTAPVGGVTTPGLRLDVGAVTSSHRATLVSRATGLDPFRGAVEVTFEGLVLSGDPAPAQPAWGNAFYATLGRASADSGTLDASVAGQYTAAGASYAGALGLLLRRSDSGVVLQIVDRGAGDHSTVSHALDGLPSRLVWSLDGSARSWSVTLEGAAFLTGPATAASGAFTRFTAGSLTVDGTTVSRLAFGAINAGNVASATVVTLDAVSVVRPEPPPPPPPPPAWALGINLASAAFGGVYPGVVGTDYGWPGAEDLDYHKARGMELVRLPFRWERIQQTLFGPLDPAELARLDAFLDLAETRGMLVIPDMHNFGRYTIGGVAHVIGSAEVPRAAFADVWEKLAAHLRHRDCLWAWGLMNEPYNMGPHSWSVTAQLGIDAIRRRDSRLPVLVGGDAYGGAHSWQLYNAELHRLVDPANNLIFEAHQYFDADHSGRYVGTYDSEGAYPDAGVDRLRPFIEWCQHHGVRGFIGEYGVPDDDPRWLVVLDRMLAHMREHGLSGTYWAAGPRWGSYKLRSNIRPGHDESPQMRTMLPHVTGPGTRYWPPFTWYHDAIAPGPTASHVFSDHSPDATLVADFAHATSSASGTYSTARGIRLAYSAPPGGWIQGGLHIGGGVDLAQNFGAGHELTFFAKATAGASVRMFFINVEGGQSARVNSSAHGTLDGTWRRIRIPLSAFLQPGFDPASRLQRLVFEGLPTDGASHVVQLDSIMIERPETVPPSVSLTVPAGPFVPDAEIAVNALADDASGIDYVEFLVGGRRRAIAHAAPYSATVRIREPGTHPIVAIAHDRQGNSARSAAQSLVIAPVPAYLASWRARHFTAEELDDPALEPSLWGARADPDGDSLPNLLEYALATNPLRPDSPDLASAQLRRENGTWLARHRRARPFPSDLVLRLQHSTDLAAPWQSPTNGAVVIEFPDHELHDTPLPTSDRHFVRLHLEVAP